MDTVVSFVAAIGQAFREAVQYAHEIISQASSLPRELFVVFPVAVILSFFARSLVEKKILSAIVVEVVCVLSVIITPFVVLTLLYYRFVWDEETDQALLQC
jgi:hypothetical protein